MDYRNYFWNPLRVNAENAFFWSDMHMMHDPRWTPEIWKIRGFNSAESHYKELISRWTHKITNSDIIFHLGDITFQQNAERVLQNLFNILPFRELYLMGGNHHAGYKQILDKSVLNGNGVYEYTVEHYKKVYFIPNYFEIYVKKQPIVLSHYPIASWNGQAKGSWMIHGHSHGSLINTDIGKILYKGKIIDVGVENTPNPISFMEIRKLFDKKDIMVFDNHQKSGNTPFS